MGRMIGNTILGAAAAAAFVVPTPASAETTPTLATVKNTLQNDYNYLAQSAENYGTKHAVPQNHIGTVAMKESTVIFNDGSTGTAKEIQVDVYNKRLRILQEYVVDVYTPSAQASSFTTSMPNSLFQISLYQGKNDRAQAPKTPAGFSRAINWAATRLDSNGYNFSLRAQQDGSWEETVSHTPNTGSEVFTTEPISPLNPADTSAASNFSHVKQLTAQAKHLLFAAEHQRPLPKGAPADLRPTHP